MTDSSPSNKPHFLPVLQSRWWSLVLGFSLMINLLIAGAFIGVRLRDGPLMHQINEARGQIVPHKFIAELPKDRRRELTQVLRDNRDQLSAMRNSISAANLKLASALEQPDFDAPTVKLALDEFTTGSSSMAARNGTILMELMQKLTPDERKKLAADIRDRDAHQRPKQ